MTAEKLFDYSCVQIALSGKRAPDRSLTINGWLYDKWPESLVIRGVRFRFVEEKGERAATEFASANAINEHEEVRGYYRAAMI